MRTPTPRKPPAKPSRFRGGGPAGGTAESRESTSGRSLLRDSRPQPPVQAARLAVSSGAEAISLREDRREMVCSMIGLTVKVGLAVMAGVSLFRLAGAYQERMERQAELAAVLEIEQAQLAKARHRFDELFMVAGEQKLIREQSQWIAPNRLRVVWQTSDPLSDRPALAMQAPAKGSQQP